MAARPRSNVLRRRESLRLRDLSDARGDRANGRRSRTRIGHRGPATVVRMTLLATAGRARLRPLPVSGVRGTPGQQSAWHPEPPCGSPTLAEPGISELPHRDSEGLTMDRVHPAVAQRDVESLVQRRCQRRTTRRGDWFSSGRRCVWIGSGTARRALSFDPLVLRTYGSVGRSRRHWGAFAVVKQVLAGVEIGWPTARAVPLDDRNLGSAAHERCSSSRGAGVLGGRR